MLGTIATMMVNGKWEGQFEHLHGVDAEGGFIRSESLFRNWITPDGSAGPTGKGGFPAASNRYHLYIAYVCPWACRTLMARSLKGLEQIVSVSAVEPVLTDQVWRFGNYIGSDHDPLHGVTYLHELYSRADPHYSGEITVPVLWDKERATIVNNESSEIIRMFNSGFGELADNAFDLYPLELRSEIDAVNERLYEPFNNGVYRAGFATTQRAYEQAVTDVFSALDYLDLRLTERDWLVGDRLTEADIRAFVTLVRFDIAYVGLFKTNLREVRDYPSLRAYLRRIYELPGISATVNLDHVKQGYYSLSDLNPSGIVPLGPDPQLLF